MQSQSEINVYLLNQLKQLTETTQVALQTLVEMRGQIKDLQEVAVLLQASSTRNSKTNSLLVQVFAHQVKLSENAIKTVQRAMSGEAQFDQDSSEEILRQVKALLKSM